MKTAYEALSKTVSSSPVSATSRWGWNQHGWTGEGWMGWEKHRTALKNVTYCDLVFFLVFPV